MSRLSLLSAIFLIGCCLSMAASAQQQVALSIYVHEGNLNGTMLSGVSVTGQDGQGGSLQWTTDAEGVAVIKGHPGEWNLAFEKENYQELELTYQADQTEEVAAYLERKPSSSPINLTLFVYEGSMNGTALSGVQVSGNDAAGEEFSATTDSSGSAPLTGTVGSWELTLSKAGYIPVVNLAFETAESEEVGAYLTPA
jgi:hypothetical protein